jgi:hypothetical protein
MTDITIRIRDAVDSTGFKYVLLEFEGNVHLEEDDFNDEDLTQADICFLSILEALQEDGDFDDPESEELTEEFKRRNLEEGELWEVPVKRPRLTLVVNNASGTSNVNKGTNDETSV